MDFRLGVISHVRSFSRILQETWEHETSLAHEWAHAIRAISGINNFKGMFSLGSLSAVALSDRFLRSQEVLANGRRICKSHIGIPDGQPVLLPVNNGSCDA
jgi:hypothetical protein